MRSAKASQSRVASDRCSVVDRLALESRLRVENRALRAESRLGVQDFLTQMLDSGAEALKVQTLRQDFDALGGYFAPGGWAKVRGHRGKRRMGQRARKR